MGFKGETILQWPFISTSEPVCVHTKPYYTLNESKQVEKCPFKNLAGLLHVNIPQKEKNE